MNIQRNEWRYGDQDQIKLVTTAAYTAGDVIVVGANVIGIALADAVIGDVLNVATAGVWEMKRGAAAIAIGVSVYWNSTSKEVTTTAGTNAWLGVTVPTSQPAFDNTCYVQLRQRTLAPA